jgi:magnesium-protoporphyrin IX monomethyl ester (oxidative) cyclase
MRENVDVEIIDTQGEAPSNYVQDGDLFTFGLSLDEVKRRIASFSPDVVGISCLFSSRLVNTLKIAQATKEADKDIKVMLGGIEPTIRPFETLQNKNVDFVVIGEAEQTLCDFAAGKEYEQLDGFGYKNRGHIKINEKTRFIDDVDSIPFPARHLFPPGYFKRRGTSLYGFFARRFNIHNVQRNSIITSRGCPNNCVFCSIHCTWGYKWRARSPENVISELRQMKDDFGVKQVSFDDDNLALSKKRILKLCELMRKERLDLRWDTPNGIAVNSLDKEVLTAMKESGCYSLNLAVESGDRDILRAMKKPVDLNKAKGVIKICKQIGIRTFAYFVLGIPTETTVSMQNSLAFAKDNPLDEIRITIATPFPKTKLYDECIKKGYIHSFSTPIADNDIWHLDPVISTPALSVHELLNFKSKFYYDFNHSSWGRLRRHMQRRILGL